MTNEADKLPVFEKWWDEHGQFCRAGGGDYERTFAWAAWLAAPAAQPATPELIDRLKLEAQIQAQEARTANATIAEIYQLITGATGEPGNWHGAEPVRAYIAEQRKLMAVVDAAKAWHEADVDNDAESLIAELKLHDAIQHLKGEQP